MARKKVIVIGSGNAALRADIAALEEGADTMILEKATAAEAGGNSRYTTGAMRFAYQSGEDLLPLLSNSEDERLKATEFGSYPVDRLVAAESFSEVHEKLQRQFVPTSTGPEPMFNCQRRMPTIFLTIERYKPESLGLFARRQNRSVTFALTDGGMPGSLDPFFGLGEPSPRETGVEQKKWSDFLREFCVIEWCSVMRCCALFATGAPTALLL